MHVFKESPLFEAVNITNTNNDTNEETSLYAGCLDPAS